MKKGVAGLPNDIVILLKVDGPRRNAKQQERLATYYRSITPGLKVLDLGCGDGTTALPAARLGAEVLGVDIARNLVDAGNKRARASGLPNCRFQHGDASRLSGIADPL